MKYGKKFFVFILGELLTATCVSWCSPVIHNIKVKWPKHENKGTQKPH